MAMDEAKMWREFVYEHLPAYVSRGVFWDWPMLPYFTGYEHGTLFDWDLYFEGIVQLYAGYPTDYIRGGICNFLTMQRDDGFIPCIVPRGGSIRRPVINPCKPFLAQSVLLVLHQGDPLAWLRGERYGKLRKFVDHWLGPLSKNKVGLPVWANAGNTGMDNHFERAGMGEAYYCCGVDLAGYMVRECESMAVIADTLGEKADVKRYAAAAAHVADLAREKLWDDAEGIFYDRHAHDDELIKVKHVGTFASMWSKFATEHQAKRLVREHLMNEAEFWRPYPIPALAATEPGYVQGHLPDHSTGCCSWRAHTWMPTNYYSFRGLLNYGFDDEATQLAERTWKMFLRGRFVEYFTSETGINCGRSPFWGWTALGLFFKPEMNLGIDATAIVKDNDAAVRLRAWLEENLA